MWRAVLLFLALAAVAWAAARLADYPGAVSIDWIWDDTPHRAETSAAVAGAALFILLLVLLALHRVWRWLAQGPGAWRRRREGSRLRRGYDVLTQGLVAVAAGDSGQGRKLARRADALLEGSPLTLLLAAQAAQLEGDEATAKRHFEALRAVPETAFLGLRGLLVLAKRADEQEAARQLAEDAFRLRPDAAWAANELFLVQAESADWDAAIGTLERAGRGRKSGDEASERRRQIALLGQARLADARGEPRRALERALKAVAKAPSFVPASALAVRLHAAAGDRRKALRLLAEAWRQAPHPELARAFAELHAGDDAKARLAAAERLAAAAPKDLESLILIASYAIEAGAREQAETAIEEALMSGDSVRACRLRARLHERHGAAGAEMQRWLERAAAATDPAWFCQTCGWQGGDWLAICPHCGDFDSLGWGRPPGRAEPIALPEATSEPIGEAAIAPPAELLQMDERSASRTATQAAVKEAAEP